MPAKNRKQQRALAAKFGWDWVEEHGFDVINADAYENNRAMRAEEQKPKHRKKPRRRHH